MSSFQYFLLVFYFITLVHFFSIHPEYKDERSKEQKESFEEMIREKEEVAKDKEFYDLMFEKHPEVTPKSFSGYRRMKASNSENYKKLLKQAEELLGYNFYKEN